jgi:hypothetical protein
MDRGEGVCVENGLGYWDGKNIKYGRDLLMDNVGNDTIY